MQTTFIQDKMVNSNRILYTPSSFAKNHLIHLQETGTLEALAEHTSKRSRLSSFLFFRVKYGSGALVYEGVTYELSAGDCVFLDCSKTYSHHTSKDLWCLQWAHFDGPNLTQIYEHYSENNASPVFHPIYTHTYEKILTELHEIATCDNPARDMMIYEKIVTLLTLIMQDCEHLEAEKITSSKILLLKDVRNYLDEHFREKISLDDLSSLFYIDKYYLTRCFKQQYGYTIHTHLQNLKITHAKELLRFSDDSIEKIAAECGIDDPNYFARLFKKIEGISPGEFRRRWKGRK